ncbi:MAG: type I methionyl aminopeptidase [Candidatus Terrybacteria bacterium RIFCSPLOWO2_01_FULL_44_24]|uniref:Methionine aminopeptidase n=1 Tax=Candidatus Terrybacteria bacterium RIFCSPHIGHO2_01_FULL_43_35 TaxID=1802361 RepID=A0A1G2PF21_9BACT|nr:MAG: type I methionyl aminopeptidase [Candidatus Terrybacteria bacterium RIFCSPHIGHO2_01_FULL_43_35]OHA49447.1 MAG: type I methionyl aminopeptidase [Candidatus Terrybacteria bacterium RIFCSPHIGHO2_02_FULL_43_14]OHA51640.1 MAG: type I methionyl aminopeptidase [Candidatus Terrybacteria bacterium RIFCSPLOWO2_01_FULL_44_24]
MRVSGRLCAEILKKIASMAKAGISPHQINAEAKKLIEQVGVKPAFLEYQAFPAVMCASVNNVAVHGVPSKIVLKNGDIIGLDFGVVVDGWYSDSALTVGIGNISYAASCLIHVTREALARGIAQAKVGNRIGDISAAIQFYVEKEEFSPIRELVGHGIGRKLHELPHVPNWGAAGAGEKIVSGMVLAIEPIISAGSPNLKQSADGFGFETIDKSLVAHFEHTVSITTAGTEILTKV